MDVSGQLHDPATLLPENELLVSYTHTITIKIKFFFVYCLISLTRFNQFVNFHVFIY